MMSNSQEALRLQRVKATIKLFLENNGQISDESLANILILSGIVTSSSTVGRDLTGNIAKSILTEDEYNQICKLRAENKLKGNQKGGIISNLKNNFQKDENGKFAGSIRNGR